MCCNPPGGMTRPRHTARRAGTIPGGREMPELRENREIDGPAIEAVEVAEIAKLV